jgi:hypothetical protein
MKPASLFRQNVSTSLDVGGACVHSCEKGAGAGTDIATRMRKAKAATITCSQHRLWRTTKNVGARRTSTSHPWAVDDIQDWIDSTLDRGGGGVGGAILLWLPAC